MDSICLAYAVPKLAKVCFIDFIEDVVEKSEPYLGAAR